ncbi:cobalamin biosynthesis protein CbiX [Thermosipho melanesiensis]|uniref:Cobalamin (Vitamin B12) biosynthesis CbiX protein n=2 Tax=Thermosipho melanesiensis TaxID=46541 RepID=A6LKV9_THEM4|nr:CbiX/SirB N-terminal domain-containing protein [Thermosipho melanesiensis]ABR30560.1 cobalamin (vitamin B12) biosynthesis CbiX protein [Thermosipho melanesiensis BI429]APT73708.1 sirohydrochlorin cobaltochelatase [Thermosipho melanesiensis]OOC35647.1 cobalamin biosynthesis protein CbiX [Thermosipho melanesiensis]OOC38946.1 cobalamin biosynthesis protein CbiX [Thermosipho melanesiensis]OOC39094.1 cobalamin biosynthesis protein CbiX [Thermosipho melanesiensis]
MKNILLVAHGSKVEETKQIVFKYFEDIKRKYPNTKLGFMEFNTPSIDDALKEFLNENVTKIYVLPLFLYEGNHIKKDIPEIISKYKINATILPPLLYDKRISEILFERIENL